MMNSNTRKNDFPEETFLYNKKNQFEVKKTFFKFQALSLTQ